MAFFLRTAPDPRSQKSLSGRGVPPKLSRRKGLRKIIPYNYMTRYKLTGFDLYLIIVINGIN